MNFKLIKPTVHWTDEQIEQITKDLTAYLKSYYGKEIISVEILDFKSKDPNYHNASTMYVEIEYIFYTLGGENDEYGLRQRDGTEQTMGTTIYADGEQCLSASIYDVFTSQEHNIINYVSNFFAEHTY
jgi:hypothetical protein